jgi:hypothetical protein
MAALDADRYLEMLAAQPQREPQREARARTAP